MRLNLGILLGTVLGVLGVVGGWVGMHAALRKRSLPDKRRFVLRWGGGFAAFILVWLGLMFAAVDFLPQPWSGILPLSVLMPVLILLTCDPRLNEIESRSERRLAAPCQTQEAPEPSARQTTQETRNLVAGAMGGILGSASWIFLILCKTGDWLAFSIMAATVVLISILAIRRLVRLPAQTPPLLAACTTGSAMGVLGIVGLLVIGLRTSAWQALTTYDLHTATAINVAMIIIGMVLNIGARWQHVFTKAS